MDCILAKRILQETIDDMYITESNHVQYEAMKIAVDALGAYSQVKRERDIAIQQLHDLGVEFGEKVVNEDCIQKW